MRPSSGTAPTICTGTGRIRRFRHCISGDGTTLPGSPAFYSYKNLSNTWELLDNVIRAHGRHVTTAGGGMLFRSTSGYLTAGRDGAVPVQQHRFLRAGPPRVLLRGGGPPGRTRTATRSYNRDYRYRQFFFFAQDSFKVTSRLTLNYGVRYENYGAPSNVGRNEGYLVQLGSGANFGQRLASCDFDVSGASGDQQLYRLATLATGRRASASPTI